MGSNTVITPTSRPTRVLPPAQKKEPAKAPRSLTIPGGPVDENSFVATLSKALDKFSSRQVTDPFQSLYGLMGDKGEIEFSIIEPEFPLDRLALLCQEDTTLGSCIDAIATNTTCFGYSLEYIGPEGGKESAGAKAEDMAIRNFLESCNPDESIPQVADKVVRDRRTFGHAYIEVGRDTKGEIVFAYHVPAQTMRVTVQEKKEVEISVKMRRGGTIVTQPAFKRFRRFVQLRGGGIEKVYFKEFGDTRRISRKTGRVFGENESADIRDEEASEIIWLNRYSPGFVYGLPDYISCIPAILGSREAALTNLDFFQENAIPALAVLISGGMLSTESIDALRSQFTKRKGRQSMNRALVLEARVAEEDKSDDPSVTTPAPKIDMKPMTADRQGDALFQEYTKNNSNLVRQAFRLPPLLVGISEDYNRSTSESSLEMAEAQVFGPERSIIDSVVNGKLMLLKGETPTTYWKYRSNAARVASPEAKTLAMEKLDAAGGMTPNIAINLANDMFGFQIPLVKEKWGDLPFGIVQSMADQGIIKPETGFPDAPPPPEPKLPTGGSATGGGINRVPGKVPATKPKTKDT